MANKDRDDLLAPCRLSVEAMIEIWAARCCGSELDETPKWLLASLRTGGFGPDETATAMMHYVESVPSFRGARPALVWVHIHGSSPRDYRPQCPGESHRVALVRMGWGEFLNLPPKDLCQAVLESFRRDLERLMQEKPFVSPRPLYGEPDAQAVAAQVTAEVDDSLTRAGSLAAAIRSRRNR